MFCAFTAFLIVIRNGKMGLIFQFLLMFILLFCFALVFSYVISLLDNNCCTVMSDDKHEESLDVEQFLDKIAKFIIGCIFVIFVYVVIIWIHAYFSIKSLNTYQIIDEDKAVVFSTIDYYVVLDCKIEDNKLILYRGKQTKIDTNDVFTELKNFDVVEVK